jgi:hypothetical protein
MIVYENLAALPGAIALVPGSVWIAALILAVLAAVIAVRLFRERNAPKNETVPVHDEEFLRDLLFGADRAAGPETPGKNHGRENLQKENRAGRSREHLP